MNIDTTTFMATVLGASVLVYGMLRMGEWMYVEAQRRGKARIIFVDQDAGETRIRWMERKGNEIELPNRRIILDANARLPGSVATWFINPRTGHNYVPLTDAETINRDSILQKLAISDPAMYHNAIARNKPRDALRANDPSDEWGWVKPAAIAGSVVMVVLVVVMGLVVYKLG